MMRRLFLLVFSFVLSVDLSAQFGYFNSDEFWSKMELHHASDVPVFTNDDTLVLVASNRALDTSSLRFLPEKRDGQKVRYFLVYSGDGKWHVQPLQSLREGINHMPDRNKDWVVYTEGMGKFFTSDVDRGMNLSAQYHVNVLLLDYPSITAKRKRLGNYFFAKKNASVAHKDFIPVLDTVRRLQEAGLMGSSGVNLFFHSMGNIVLQQAMRHNASETLNASVWVNNLILNAPCIPQRGHRKMIEKIGFARKIFINYNPGDFTLGGAYLLSKRYQLGKQVCNPVSSKAIYVNFNTLVNEGHSNFLNLRSRNAIPDAALKYYNALFHGSSPNIADTNSFRVSRHRGIGYDILP